MAGVVRERRSSTASGALRGLFSYRVFVSALFTLVFLATLSALLSSEQHQHNHLHHYALPSSPAFIHRTFLALKSVDPLKTRLELLSKHTTDHLSLLNAYASYARKLKLDYSKQLLLFDHLSRNFSDLAARAAASSEDDAAAAAAAAAEDSIKHLEKEFKERVKTARLLISETKESFDNQIKIQKLRDTIFAVNEQLLKAKKQVVFSSSISAKSIPKSLHCLGMRLVGERVARPERYVEVKKVEFEDPSLYHYAIFSDSVIAVSVVVNSAAKNAEEPRKHVFHVVTDRMNLGAMQVWFTMRPPHGGAHVEIRALDAFNFLNPLSNHKNRNSKYLSMLNHLRFYLPEMYPKLHKMVLLDDDVVVQKDLTGLWRIELDGKVNGAVEICFGSFHRLGHYFNFSHPLIKERFNPKSCAWAYGVNVFDLDAWRRDKCTDQYHYWHNMNENENQTLWKLGTLPPGLITFYSTTKPLDKSWHVLGLGYNPSISMDEINSAAVIHYNGNMKPWLDIALNQFRPFWTKYVDYEMEFVQMCNFGL
ncbi:hypothetical protein Sjap_015242 [Stephania japonica]|uniref:Hexosyltransferase n=1 Tax=Stephania japonica TaxID=461633 RepID=A0AAP0IJI6_9MAGN